MTTTNEPFDFFGNQFEIQKSRDISSHTMHYNRQHHHACYQCGGKPRRMTYNRANRRLIRSNLDHLVNSSDFGSIGCEMRTKNYW